MQSEYDNPTFFEEYAKMARSRDGLGTVKSYAQIQQRHL